MHIVVLDTSLSTVLLLWALAYNSFVLGSFPFAFSIAFAMLYFSYLPPHTGLCLAADRHIFQACGSSLNIITTMTTLLVASSV
jgi:hypothetical protein